MEKERTKFWICCFLFFVSRRWTTQLNKPYSTSIRVSPLKVMFSSPKILELWFRKEIISFFSTFYFHQSAEHLFYFCLVPLIFHAWMIYGMKQEMHFVGCDGMQKVMGDMFLLGVFLIIYWIYSASSLVLFVIFVLAWNKKCDRQLYFTWKILYPFSLASMGSYVPSLSSYGNLKWVWGLFFR